MSADVIVGIQWGDEGKGKIVDMLAQKYDMVCRSQGGHNAGTQFVYSGFLFELLDFNVARMVHINALVV